MINLCVVVATPENRPVRSLARNISRKNTDSITNYTKNFAHPMKCFQKFWGLVVAQKCFHTYGWIASILHTHIIVIISSVWYRQWITRQSKLMSESKNPLSGLRYQEI